MMEAAEAVEERSAPAWLSTGEVAEHLRVSPSAVRQWRRRGLLAPDGGTPGRALYSRAMVEAFALSRSDGSAP